MVAARGIWLTGMMAFMVSVGPARAQTMVQPACPTGASAPALPAELSGWLTPREVKAASNADGLSAAAIKVGEAAETALLQTPTVTYVSRPEKPGGSVSYGGLLQFAVQDAGTYRVALGSGAWIDVLHNGAAVTSTAHGHGPDCSGIRKMVDFALEPGTYVLQLSANAGEKLPVMVARLH